MLNIVHKIGNKLLCYIKKTNIYETNIITPKDISEVIKRIGFDNMMDRMIDALTLAFQEVGKDQNPLTSRDGYIDEDASFSCVE